MATLPTDVRILFTNYDIIAYFLNLASCSEHFISIKHRILATFNNKKKNQFEWLYAFNLFWVPNDNPIIYFLQIPFSLAKFFLVYIFFNVLFGIKMSITISTWIICPICYSPVLWLITLLRGEIMSDFMFYSFI
jgi:hypothetical protein